MGPGQGGSRSSRVGRKEIIREVIGPGPGRVPGLFSQKRGKYHSYQRSLFNTNESFLCQQFFVLIHVNKLFFVGIFDNT